MLHMSSTHQMQQIHPNDLTLICPYVGVRGVGVRCSLSEIRLEQAKKTQPVNGNGHFSRKYGSGPPPPLTNTSPKSPLQGFPNLPHIPPPPPLGHSAGTNEARKAPTPENAPCWHEIRCPREIFLHHIIHFGPLPFTNGVFVANPQYAMGNASTLLDTATDTALDLQVQGIMR